MKRYTIIAAIIFLLLLIPAFIAVIIFIPFLLAADYLFPFQTDYSFEKKGSVWKRIE